MAEFVIIGGGVYGAATAFWLAEQGREVVLLEAQDIGDGASAGPGRRGTRANGRDARELPLVRLAHEMWPDLHERLGVDQFFECLGHLLLIEREEDLEPCRARALMQNALGTETHVLRAAEVREREPDVREGILGALYCPLDGVSDHTAVTNAFAAAAQRKGVEIVRNTRVLGIQIDGRRATSILTDNGERIEVGQSLLLLANAGVDELLGDRLRLPIWSRSFQVMLTEPLDRMPLNHLIGHVSRTLAMKEEAGNRIMISGGYPGTWDPESETGEAIQASIDANLADAVAVYPYLEGAKIELADANHLEALSTDDIPVIDTIPGAANAIYATAWCGHGWAIAPSVTQMLAEWAVSGERPPLLAPFAHSRFGIS